MTPRPTAITSNHWSIRVFGSLRLCDADGHETPVPGGRQRAALERLCLTPNEPVSIDDLLDACWPGGGPQRPAGALQVVLSRLRAVMRRLDGVDLRHRDESYLLEVQSHRMDLLAFEEHAARALDPAMAPERAREHRLIALELFAAGAVLDGFAETPAVAAARARIASTREVLRRPPIADAQVLAAVPGVAGSAGTQVVYVIVSPSEFALASTLSAQLSMVDQEAVLRRLLSGATIVDGFGEHVHQVRNDPYGLSERELTISRMLCSHMTLGEISRQLYISINTTKSHTRSIYRKLGVSSRAEAAKVLSLRSRWGATSDQLRVS